MKRRLDANTEDPFYPSPLPLIPQSSINSRGRQTVQVVLSIPERDDPGEGGRGV